VALKIETFKNFATFFNMLAKMKILESTVYVFSELNFGVRENSSGRRRNIAKRLQKV